MDARAVDDAAVRLRELRHEEWGDLGLAAVAVAVSVAAAQLGSALSLPLFTGGLFVGMRGIRALWRRWDLVERLAGEPDAYVISDVFARAQRDATMARRELCARGIRTWLDQSSGRYAERLSVARDDLEALADELEDRHLELDPACAVECSRLVTDRAFDRAADEELPPEEIRSRVYRIRAGFCARTGAA
jgi:hypothetical protein